MRYVQIRHCLSYISTTSSSPSSRSNASRQAQLACREVEALQRQTELRYNGFLTLRGIPPEVSEYRLGNRSALEWIVDQYQVSTDKRFGIVYDPNREDDLECILRLIGQVIHVSLENRKAAPSPWLPTES
jgi:predicted helicase